MNRGRPRTFDREAAVRKAMILFWTKGFASASLNYLTTSLKINPPSFYAAFGSKEALYREVLDCYRNEVTDKIWSPLLQDGTAQKAIENMLLNTASCLTSQHFPRGCLVSLAGMEGGLPEALANELQIRRAEMYTRLKGSLIEAQKKKEISASADCESIACFYFTVQQGMAVRARDGVDTLTLQGTVKSAMAAWPALTTA